MSIPSICPVCNGFERLQAACPDCQAEAADAGRLADQYGPYSPYRPIDDMRLTNGYDDVARRICLHTARCDRCGFGFVAAVSEVDGVER